MLRDATLWVCQRFVLNALTTGAYDSAATWLDRMERIEGRSRRVLHNRALVRLAQGDYTSVEALILEEIDRHGEESVLLRVLAECGYLAGDRDKALARLDAALADPDCPDQPLLRRRRAIAADESAYRQAMEGKRAFAEGAQLLAAKDANGARAAFARAVDLDPTDFVARNNLATLLLNQFADPAGAAHLFEEAIALCDQPVLRRNLAAARERADAARR